MFHPKRTCFIFVQRRLAFLYPNGELVVLVRLKLYVAFQNCTCVIHVRLYRIVSVEMFLFEQNKTNSFCVMKRVNDKNIQCYALSLLHCTNKQSTNEWTATVTGTDVCICSLCLPQSRTSITI